MNSQLLPSIIQAEPWLAGLGLRFNPFRHLEAANDPYLGSYLVSHQRFAVAWEEHPALIFAPAGGGKTALRMYAAHAYWLSQGRAQPFPIPYLATAGAAISPEAHQRGIVQAGAVALLIGLIHHPDLLLECDRADRRRVADLLDAVLPAPLSYYVAMLADLSDPTPVLLLLEKSYRLPSVSHLPLVRELCAVLQDAGSGVPANADAADRLALLLEVLLEVLHFRAIILQLDGVDASADTGINPAFMADWLAWPLTQAPRWAEQGIILKGFLPSELAAHLTHNFPEPLAHMQQATITWTPPLLVEVIRRRVYEASNGKIGSLDAISSPALRDVDTQLACGTPPLPRETILLVGRLFAAYAQRTGGTSGQQLEPADLAAAQTAYIEHYVEPGPLNARGIPCH